jgi:hypothetical protein
MWSPPRRRRLQVTGVSAAETPSWRSRVLSATATEGHPDRTCRVADPAVGGEVRASNNAIEELTCVRGRDNPQHMV